MDDWKVKEDIKFSILIVGDSKVFESILRYRLTKGNNKKLLEDNNINFDLKTGYYVAKIEEKIYRFQFWDTNGLEENENFVKKLHRAARCIIYVFDVAKEETF